MSRTGPANSNPKARGSNETSPLLTQHDSDRRIQYDLSGESRGPSSSGGGGSPRSPLGLGKRSRTNSTGKALRTYSMIHGRSEMDRLAHGGHVHHREAGFHNPKELMANIIHSSWVNWLLVLVPLGFLSHYLHYNKVIVFCVNFFAIIPLAGLLGYATEQLALHLGDTLGGLMNATFGNAVELLVSMMALLKGEKQVVQTSLIGSMLSNLLLVGGGCFFFGGLRRSEQSFNSSAVQTYSGLLALSLLFVLLPIAFHTINAKNETLEGAIVQLSHFSAILMLLVYIAYLFFQLKTNPELFMSVASDGNSVHSADSSINNSNNNNNRKAAQPGTSYGSTGLGSGASTQTPEGVADSYAVDFGNDDTIVPVNMQENQDEEEAELPELNKLSSAVLLAVVTIITAFCAEYLVDSIDDLTVQWNLSKSFVGLILLPIVGNAAEHVTAITVAMKDKMDLALSVAIGSSLQIFLFVLPVMCIAGWFSGQPMDLYFDLYDIVVLLFTILLVNYVIMDGRSNWLEGFMMLTAYAIIAVSYYLFPQDSEILGDSVRGVASSALASFL
ncbi:hypothetical protein EV182_003998 [Spiromyces aspiralis]|uniref:Uncharacterized protein n=1 Tax=Spiromyces aspiralis TaxID=68401 RepID=A0ACC1HBZ8_9FUNG|nr:hypothetical protein EV182_003998 [Spiromyces aspiralis]